MSNLEHNSQSPGFPWNWLRDYWQTIAQRLRPQSRLLVLSLVVGVVAGIGAIVFYLGAETVFHYTLTTVAGYDPPSAGGEQPLFPATARPLVPWWLVVIPAVGGLVCGWIIYTWAPEAEGHGTDAVIEAYHHHQGVIRTRVPLVKMIASAITLGTGGSGGREGPIAQIGAGFGSYIGGALRLGTRDRRILMAAGMGAGIGAIFRSPLAGALFAAEVLYSSADFESDVLIPAGLASVIAYSTFGLAFGWQPLFSVPDELSRAMAFDNPWQLVSYLLLAVAMVVLAMIYTRTFYATTYLFKRLPLARKLRPMIGAALTGAIAVSLYYVFERDPRVLSVLSFGYGMLQEALNLQGWEAASFRVAGLLLAIALGKIVTTSLTIGSGGSAGVFGPSMVIGGCAGGALGIVLHYCFPSLTPHPASFVLVGMAGFFAAAAKTPFSTLVMVSEMTGDYSLLLPALWVCSISFLISDRQSIYSAQLPQRPA